MNGTTPSFLKDEVDVDMDEPTDEVEREADIEPQAWLDPNAWLATPYETEQGFHEFEDGRRIKLTAITDAEEAKIRRASKRPDPRNPKITKVDPTAYRRELISHSMNKAYGFTNGAPGSVMADTLKGRPIGELNSIVSSIMRISGVPEEVSDSSDLLG